MEKLLKKLMVKKIKLEVKKRRFQLWQEEMDNKVNFTQKDSDKSFAYYIRERRLDSRIEDLQEKINYINNKRYAKTWSSKVSNLLKSIKPVNVGGNNA